MKKNKSVIETGLIVLFFAITVVTVFITHRAVPFMMDDLWYSTNLATGEPLRGIGDVFESQIWHYNNWGGRSMAHGLLQIILMQGEMFADVLNTIVTIVLAFVIYKTADEIMHASMPEEIDSQFSRKSVKKPVLYMTFIIGMLHGLNANWKMSMYWQSGSANYLYITIFILLFVRCYIREITQRSVKPLKGITFWVVPLAVIAGWSNENMGPTAWLVSLFTIIYLLKNKKSTKLWMYLGNISCLTGSALCILAPGNFVRSAEAVEEKGLFWRIYLRLYSECRGAFDFLFPALLVFLMMWALYVIYEKNVRNKGTECVTVGKMLAGGTDLQVLVLFLAAVVACGAMILSPHFPDRSTFGSMVLLIVGIVVFAMKVTDGKTAETKITPTTGLIAAGVLIWLHGMFWMFEYLGMSWGWIL